MALNLQGIITNERQTEFLEWINSISLDSCEVEYEDDNVVILKKLVKDKVSNEVIGKLVFTITEVNNETVLSDIDFVLKNENTCEMELWFNYAKPNYGNEFYEAETNYYSAHAEIEVVDRMTCPTKELEETVQNLYVSAFPFLLEIDHEETEEELASKEEMLADLNKMLGTTQISIVEDVEGFDDFFCAPGNVFQMDQEEKESYTDFAGKILDYKEVTIELLNSELSFIIAQVDSAMGVIPVAMSKECFDLSKLEVGKAIEMKADIKADFCKCE